MEMLEAIYNALVINKDAGITLSGSSVSIEERGFWLSTDPDPVPVSNRALGVVIDVATNEMNHDMGWELGREEMR